MEVTCEHLNYWYKSKFEKLGWLVLSDSIYMNEKLVEYRRCLVNLIDALNTKTQNLSDVDKQLDIQIMNMNSNKLLKTFDTVLIPVFDMLSEYRHHDHHKHDNIPTELKTLAHLKFWYKKMFKTFGWLLISNKPMNEYTHHLKLLVASLMQRMNISGNDTKEDLDIMHRNVCKLSYFVYYVLNRNINDYNQEYRPSLAGLGESDMYMSKIENNPYSRSIPTQRSSPSILERSTSSTNLMSRSPTRRVRSEDLMTPIVRSEDRMSPRRAMSSRLTVSPSYREEY